MVKVCFVFGWMAKKRGEAGGRGESETQSITGEGKEAGFNYDSGLV